MQSSGSGGGGGAAPAQPWTLPFCTIVAVDKANLSYRACSLCERPLPDDPAASCKLCSRRAAAPACTRLYRLLLSIATVDKVVAVVCFDRAARVLLGCGAAEMFDLCRRHPLAAEKAGEILEGEMCRMTLSQPKNGNAQHLRVVSVVPLCTGFRPVIGALRMLYESSSSRRGDSALSATSINPLNNGEGR